MTQIENVLALIIEDTESDADVLANLLDQLGVMYNVLLATHDSLDTFTDFDIPDVIFLDLELPGSNGYQVLESIKIDANMRHIPVVAYTSHLSEMAAARDAGFHSFLGKPLKRSAFGAQLANIINNVPVWDAR
jgi:CheY-like chemotaxis protein